MMLNRFKILPFAFSLLPSRSFLPFAFLLFAFLSSVQAQSTTATLSGTVVDANGAAVAGASVTLSNTATGFERKVTTNGEGSFTIPLLPPSNYTLTVDREGFATAQVQNVILNVNDSRLLQITLKVGQVKTEVVITTEPPLISDSPAVGTVVDRRLIENMPLNGRTFQSLLLLTPGVTLAVSNGDQSGQFSVNGQRESANYFSVDGVSANIGITSSGGSFAGTGGGTAAGVTTVGGYNNLVSVDAIQEFRIDTSSYAPEFGRTPGGQVQIATRSGAKQFHGSIFDYVRNDKFDANDWFS